MALKFSILKNSIIKNSVGVLRHFTVQNSNINVHYLYSRKANEKIGPLKYEEKFVLNI